MITHQNLKIWKMLETDLSHLKCMISRPVTITWVLSRPTWAIFKVIGMHMLTLVPGSYLGQFLLGVWCWPLRAPTPFYSSPAKFSPIFIGLNWSRDAIVYIRGGPLSAHSARPPKIPGWIVVVRENISVNKRVSKKINNWNCIEIVLKGFVCFPFQILYLAFTAFVSKFLK